MTRVVITPQAQAEIAEASDWYDAHSPRIGSDFLLAVDAALELIMQNPFQYQVVRRQARRAPVGRFPYGLFYRASEEAIVVVACLHGRRHPRRWLSRLPRTP